MVAWSLLLNLRNELMSEPPLARAGEIVDIAQVLRIVLSLDLCSLSDHRGSQDELGWALAPMGQLITSLHCKTTITT
jgi:hypothetical protein